MIRPAASTDAARIAEIYNHYIETSHVTFATERVTAEQMAADIAAADAEHPFLVGERSGQVWGYALATGWKSRCAYRHTVETSIYLDPGMTGGGRGTMLYVLLLERLRDAGVRTALGGIALPNEASVKLHEKLGYAKVAHLERVGDKFGREIDVGYWQVIL
ncbi:MAG: N-acetyltransferase [bacterium]|nr:N-acetyltransferase [bacterium]